VDSEDPKPRKEFTPRLKMLQAILSCGGREGGEIRENSVGVWVWRRLTRSRDVSIGRYTLKTELGLPAALRDVMKAHEGEIFKFDTIHTSHLPPRTRVHLERGRLLLL
jgi:hypothetical protein